MLLLTAFEPFDGTGINSSLEALQTWRAQNASSPVTTAILPVRYNEDFAARQKAVAECRPHAIVHLGQTSGAFIDIERVALNLKLCESWLQVNRKQSGSSTLHNAPNELRHEPILPDAPLAYRSTFPVEATTRALQAAALPARDSAHAGTYLCNHIFYRSLHHAATEGPSIPTAFVHLPRLPAQAGLNGTRADIPTQPLSILVRAIEIIVQIALECFSIKGLDKHERFG
ncbi:MAG: pyroglutamyl-peptidase [Abditibacteriota bacterium]|nr:pyroglutamyl-peptidase [Abditibacteriota bacterium]